MFSVDTSELRKLEVDLGTALVRVGAQAAAEVRKTGAAALAMAQELAPVDTGELRGSLTLQFEGDGRSAGMTAIVTAGTDHGGYVEYGTSDTAPQPYLGPTLDTEGPKLREALTRVLGAIL